MSANWSIRSFGKPYFCLAQQSVAGMGASGLYDDGLLDFEIEFRLFTLPVKKALDTENHPLISISGGLLGALVFELGITPLGALSVQTMNGANLKSHDGMVAPDGDWHTIEVHYDTGAGLLTMSYDADPLLSVVDAGGALLHPDFNRIRLFNGRSGLARADVAIRRVQISGPTSGPDTRVATYLFDERAGSFVAGTKDDGDFPAVSDFGLTAEFMVPMGYVLPWGPVPTEGLSDAYRWLVDTEYEDVTPSETAYEEMEVL